MFYFKVTMNFKTLLHQDIKKSVLYNTNTSTTLIMNTVENLIVHY